MKHSHLKINEKFLETFIRIESTAAKKLGITTAGVTEYITKLGNMKNVNGGEETSKQLIKFRSIRNRLVHEAGALRSLDLVTKEDLKWLTTFEKKLNRGKDPIFAHEKEVKGKKTRKTLGFIVLAVLIAAVAAIIISITG